MAQPLIVVVDSSREAREAVADVLIFDGIRALACASAEQALELIHGERPDAVITDVTLEGMSGLDLISRVRTELLPPVPAVIACSAFAPFEHDALRRGAALFIPKPFELDTLRAAVRSVLDHRPFSPEEREAAASSTRRLREHAVRTAEETTARLGPRLEELRRHGARSISWFPRYLGFGEMFHALVGRSGLRIGGSSQGRHWPVGRVIDDIGVCRDILETGAPLTVPDLPSLGVRVLRADGGVVRFFAGLPLRSSGVVIGVVCLVDDAPRMLQSEDFTLLSTLVQRVSDVFDESPRGPLTQWSGAGLLTVDWLRLLIASEMARAARVGCGLHLAVACGARPPGDDLPPRTALAELAADRFALLAVTASTEDEELLGRLRALSAMDGFRGAGLLSIAADAIAPFDPDGVLGAAERLCARGVRTGGIERSVLRREPLELHPG